jgi:hypothetical protein
MIKYANAVDSEQAIDATPTDAATTGNQFRLSESVWVYNLIIEIPPTRVRLFNQPDLP